MSAELVFALNASCGDCGLLGPPPSEILTLPPPPMPAFLQRLPVNNDTPSTSASPCERAEQACEWGRGGAPGVQYVELPRQVSGVGDVDDTWFLVLVSCSVGVFLLGAVLAVILMRCRQGRGNKCVLSLDPSALDGKSGKLACGEVLYPDPRALWAALTPSGGTQHFVAPALAPVRPHLQLTQRHLSAPAPAPRAPSPSPPPLAEPEYAMPLTGPFSAGPPPLEPPPPPPVRVAAFAPPSQPRHHVKHSPHPHPRQHGHVNKMATLGHASTAAAQADTNSFDFDFDNSGFVDSDDQLLAGEAYSPLGFYHTVGGGRRGSLRPKVSSPTRIPHPNLPPLNLHPTTSRRSLRRAARRGSDAHSSNGGLAL